jgi:hypothetical protein
MATITKCYTPIKGRVLRVTLLDTCGAVVTGASGAQIVAGGYTQVSSSAQYDTGDRTITRTADDELCVNDKAPDILTNFELDMMFCLFDPGLVANTISPARLLTYSEGPTGTGFALAEGAATSHWSLEVWQRVSGRAACDAGGLPQWVYNAWPHLTDGKIGDYLISSAPSVLEIQANSLAVSPLWTIGDAWLGAGAVSVVPDHWFQNLTTVTPPTAACGIQTPA